MKVYFFAAEYTITLEKRSAGKLERVEVITEDDDYKNKQKRVTS